METVVLAVGYAMAIPVCVRLVPVLREQRVSWFAVLQVGTALIVAGHLLRDDAGGAIANVAFFVIFWIGWFRWPRRPTADQ